MSNFDNQDGYTPASQAALDAVEDLLKPRKKNFLERNFIPLKRDSKREKTRKVILDILLVIMLACVLILLYEYVYLPHRIQSDIDDLIYIHNQTNSNQPTQPGGASETVIPLSDEKLKAINSDYIGWLKVPGADIELPIVKTTDNEAYLTLNFYKQKSKYGNPFLDYRCSLDPVSDNLVIYGHHMKDGNMFGKLKNYRSASTFSKNPIITLQLPGRVYQYKIISVFVTNGVATDDNGYIFHFDAQAFPTEDNFNGFIHQLNQRTLYRTGVDVRYGDHLITLQTCEYDFADAVLIVIGRQVRQGESLEIDKSKITQNSNPRYPQALYDKRGRENPYRNAERWYPGPGNQ
ncbi:MAG: class B sortase [Oscillospiraceae bacterium]|jgi:SrtB family sortase|nr:class B sortase [Oscillospiraceae bacterium]